MIEEYKMLFGLDDWKITFEKIRTVQVVDYDGKVGQSLIGIDLDRDNKIADFYHTKQLGKKDIIHELLHIRYPTFSEEEVDILMHAYANIRKSSIEKYVQGRRNGNY